MNEIHAPSKDHIAGFNAGSSIRRFSWDIFEVAYEVPSRGIDILTTFSLESLFAYRIPAQFTLRLLKDVLEIAPTAFMTHITGSLWMSFAPALSLYLSHMVFGLIQQSIIAHEISIYDRVVLQLFVCMWLLTAFFSSYTERHLEENKLLLGGHLRSHFLPQLVRASLRLDMTYLQGKLTPEYRIRASFPSPWSFGEDAPGLEILNEISTRLRNNLTVFLEVLVFIYIISQQAITDARVLSCLGLVFAFVVCLAPSNGTEGAGYTFWTKNKQFYRLGTLYSIIFSGTYRQTLAKDGLNEFLSEEYKRTSDSLGIVKADTLAFACRFPPPLYWTITRTLIIEYPIALYALTLPWQFSTRSLASMALFQYAITAVKHSIDCVRGGQDPAPLLEILKNAQKLYITLESNNKTFSGVLSYPDPVVSSQKGMKISFRDVCFRYESTADPEYNAVSNVSFDVEPGQLVVIVGVNGSGKTSLLRLLPRLADTSSGEIYVDDRPLIEYDTLQLRHSMAILLQSEDIYPVSLSENLMMGLVDPIRRQVDTHERLDEAAKLGGSFDLIQRLGYETVLNPFTVVGQSLRGCGNGEIGEGAFRKFERNTPKSREIPISCGEKQRLVASRTFMKVKNSDIRLLIVDEPTSALDPIAERDLFNRFNELKDGRTVIFVTHRFSHVVKKADLILCMKSGRIVERGKHGDLMHEGGEYSRMYKAQADCFENERGEG